MNTQSPILLFAETDAVVRNSIAQFLRDCGYKVIEVSDNEEAACVLKQEGLRVSVALLDTNGKPKDAFSLAQWIRAHSPETNIVIAGSVDAAADKASELCKMGPVTLPKPYEPSQLVELITRMRAERAPES